MVLFPKVKLKTLPTFPSTVYGGTGIDVAKQNGALTVDLDYSEFGSISAIPTSPTNHILTYDTATNSYVMIPSNLLGGAVAGISDAPLDGKVYGRQSAGWINAWASPTFTGLPVFNSPGGFGYRMVGDGSTTPSKYIRVNAGDFQITSDANATILDLTDAGILTTSSIVLNPASGSTNVALQTTQHAAGTSVAGNSSGIIPAGSYNLNSINIASDATGLAGPNAFVNGLAIMHDFGGPATMGGRQSLYVQLTQDAADNPANTAPSWVAGCFFAQSGVNNGGTGLTAGTSRGGIFGLNPVIVLYPGATNWNQATGIEINTALQSGSSVYFKAGISISQEQTDAAQGAVFDAGINFTNAPGAVGWKNGILFSNGNGQQPVASNGTLIATQGAGTVATGINFTSYSISGNAIATPGFAVGGNGSIHTSTAALPQLQIDNPSGQLSELAFSHAGTTTATIAWDNTNSDVIVNMLPAGSNFIVQVNGAATFIALAAGLIRVGAAGFTANGIVATQMSGVGPPGSHTTPQEWFTVQNSAGVTRYIPAY